MKTKKRRQDFCFHQITSNAKKDKYGRNGKTRGWICHDKNYATASSSSVFASPANSSGAILNLPPFAGLPLFVFSPPFFANSLRYASNAWLLSGIFLCIK